MSDDDYPESLVQDDEEGGFVDLDLRLTRLDVRPAGTFFAEGRLAQGSQDWIRAGARCRVDNDPNW